MQKSTGKALDMRMEVRYDPDERYRVSFPQRAAGEDFYVSRTYRCCLMSLSVPKEAAQLWRIRKRENQRLAVDRGLF